MLPTQRPSLLVEGGLHTVGVKRPVEVVGHVLFTAPDQLDRVSNLACDGHCLGDEVEFQTPTECATDQLVVHLDFFHGQPGDLGRRLLGEHRHLGADPQLAGIFTHMGHAAHGLKR